MSAFLCTEAHLSLLANSASDDRTTRKKLFDVLLLENLRSLATRYPSDKSNFACADAMAWQNKSAVVLVAESLGSRSDGATKFIPRRTLQTQIVKACDCYDYQACQTGDYETTFAAKVIYALRSAAIAKGGETDGALYDQVKWELG